MCCTFYARLSRAALGVTDSSERIELVRKAAQARGEDASRTCLKMEANAKIAGAKQAKRERWARERKTAAKAALFDQKFKQRGGSNPRIRAKQEDGEEELLDEEDADEVEDAEDGEEDEINTDDDVDIADELEPGDMVAVVSSSLSSSSSSSSFSSSSSSSSSSFSACSSFSSSPTPSSSSSPSVAAKPDVAATAPKGNGAKKVDGRRVASAHDRPVEAHAEAHEQMGCRRDHTRRRIVRAAGGHRRDWTRLEEVLQGRAAWKCKSAAAAAFQSLCLEDSCS